MSNAQTASASTLKTYTKKEMSFYLASMAGQNLLYASITACLAYYMQFTIAIPAIAVSVIMAAARIWDAFNDPIMGTIVDRTRTKWGKMRPYLLFIPIPLAVLTALCFTNFGIYGGDNSDSQNALIIAWAAFIYIVFGMAYTIGDIPLWGITALMTEDKHQRNKLLSLARISGAVAAGVVTFVMQPAAFGIGEALTESSGSAILAEKTGFFIIAAALALVGGGLFQLAGIFVREKIPPSEKRFTLKENFQIMWRNKPFRQILLSGIFGSSKNLTMIVAMPIVSYYFADKSPMLSLVYMALLGGGLFIGQFAALGVMPKLVKKYEKHKMYNFSNLAMLPPFILIFLLYLLFPNDLVHPAAIASLFLLFGIVGVGTGATMALSTMMIADAVDYEEHKYGSRPDGIFFSGMTFIAKLSGGVASIISGIAYSIVGFSDDNVTRLNDYVATNGSARGVEEFMPYMFILFFLATIPPAIGCILSVIPTRRYALSDKEHENILRELNERRHSED
ncbi:MAG: glycoside-pentoside-hexuronide (GPH):cation symporter [Clostridiales bacterium]|jgi:sugar (glycoside-pentoside-hexuronide) transporter|nr:glycoside-pentoside-hexuronide (GPH):cation symporter [Clostridiales bacterium]